MPQPRKKVAFWFRYGPADHAELHPCMPGLVRKLAESCEVHYFSMRGTRPPPPVVADACVLHLLPFTVNRASTRDKAVKLLLWYMLLPLLALRCRFMRIDILCIDDYMPLGALVARVCFGRRVVVWVADFLHAAYAEQMPLFKPLASLITAIDLAVWKRCPLIFTLAKSTKTYLVSRGVPPERIHPVYDPCDTRVYHPLPKDEARSRWGYSAGETVLVHHGVLHPNKGMDRIVRALPPVVEKHAGFRFFIVGAGPELARLKALVTELGLEKAVQFAGWLPSVEEVNTALNAGDIGLVMRIGQLSDHFHTTSALAHSMAAGLPILSARLGGDSDIITDGENGLLFDPDDMAEFRAKLETLITRPELRERFGAAVVPMARELFDVDTVIRKHAEPILDLAEQSVD